MFAIRKRKYSENLPADQASKIRRVFLSTLAVPPADPDSSPAPASATGFRRIASALTYRDFRVMWFGAFTSTIGTWMQKVAQNWLVLTITGSSSAFFLGLDSFLGELPILLLTLVGGVD